MAASPLSVHSSQLPDQLAAQYSPSKPNRVNLQQGDHPSHLEDVLEGVGIGMTSSIANIQSLRYQRPVYEVAQQHSSAPDLVLDVLRKRQQTDSASVSVSASASPTTATNDDVTTAQLPTGVTEISGQPSATTEADSRDNLLAIMPPFAFSMPAQILVTGINIALVSVIAVHLLFTVHYHIPLSRDNWLFQICSTLMLLLSLIVYLSVVFSAIRSQSHKWPYTFDYLAAVLPPTDGSWTTVRSAFFLLMRAITTLLIHSTHIQFLTLLYPSALEARLILWMLGPLALIAAGMEFTELSDMDDVKTSDLGDAIRNICNSTLTLLYSCALLIWGGLVNRRRAWRSDGGTASFGGGAMGLAAMNTVMSFVQIRYDRLWWLPDICWTLTLWQSWLGFWWWVGAGMGIGEVEDREARAEKRRKWLARQKRKAAKRAEGGEEGGSDVLTGFKRLKDRITGDASQKTNSSSSTGEGVNGATLTRRRTRPDTASNAMELDEIGIVAGDRDAHQIAPHADTAAGDGPHELTGVAVVGHEAVDAAVAEEGGPSSAAGSSATTSGQTSSHGLAERASGWLDAYTPRFVKQRMRRLRIAHAAAAAKAADEQTIVRNQVLGGTRQPGLRAMMLDRDDDASQSRRPSRVDTNQAGSRRQSAATVHDKDRRDRSNGRDGSVSSASRRPPSTSGSHALILAASATGRSTHTNARRSSTRADTSTVGSASEAYPSTTLQTPTSLTSTAFSSPFSTSSDQGVRNRNGGTARTVRAEEFRRDSAGTSTRSGEQSDTDDEGVWVEEEEEEGGPRDTRAATSAGNDQPNDGAATSAPSPSTSASGPLTSQSIAATSASAGQSSTSSTVVVDANGEDSRSDASSGSATEIAPAQPMTSWTWRGGLSRARLRDRQTYK